MLSPDLIRTILDDRERAIVADLRRRLVRPRPTMPWVRHRAEPVPGRGR